MQFSDSLPQNILELTQIIQNLSQDVSTETRLSLLPFIENPADEMEKKADEEQEKNDEDYSKLEELFKSKKVAEEDEK